MRRCTSDRSERLSSRKPLSAAVAILAVLGLTLLVMARPVAAEEPLSPEALDIANQLNCPVCQGQSVRDSNSELARQMRQLIQQKLDRGESREEILQYFVDRYGVGVLREPPRQGYLWLLWWGPVIGLVVGVLVVVLYLRRRSTSGDESVPVPPPDYVERVERLLRAEGESR
ncbi:MAG: cytochrome c-type biogenesis protein CcmH [Thermomicrobium sp.]|nr:cytochrome c-type biogenesis protein CcmH [Thermomicrobium sp.]MDW8058520.1 cytochrome c-type biogenesis protein CcmH [Thermomicrobium sp.]